MHPLVTRRRFLHVASVSGVALTASPGVAQPTGAAPEGKPKVQKPPALAPELVREFVGAGHGDLEKVKSMLAAEPGLLNATWDWGGGDFESAIGGAGHMGRRDIAEYLIAQGARMDLFVAAMLGEVGVVRAIIGAWPAARESKGPHGIMLLAHAIKGGEGARAVVEWLEGSGG